jgi:hypothetical protein
MVLKVGAVRHKLSDALAEDRDALGDVEQADLDALDSLVQNISVSRSAAAGRDHPRIRGRRPVDGPGRPSHAALARAGHRSRGRGQQRA